MYRELGTFVWHMVRQRAVWRDGELWTAAIVGVGVGWWIERHPEVAPLIKAHFGDLLTVTGIVFGFVLTMLVFYVQAASAWSSDVRVQNVAERLVDWHVLTILTLLALLAYTVVLWALGGFLPRDPRWIGSTYGLLVFLMLYGGFQILNHTLTVWWMFRGRERLRQPSGENAPR